MRYTLENVKNILGSKAGIQFYEFMEGYIEQQASLFIYPIENVKAFILFDIMLNIHIIIERSFKKDPLLWFVNRLLGLRYLSYEIERTVDIIHSHNSDFMVGMADDTLCASEEDKTLMVPQHHNFMLSRFGINRNKCVKIPIKFNRIIETDLFKTDCPICLETPSECVHCMGCCGNFTCIDCIDKHNRTSFKNEPRVKCPFCRAVLVDYSKHERRKTPDVNLMEFLTFMTDFLEDQS